MKISNGISVLYFLRDFVQKCRKCLLWSKLFHLADFETVQVYLNSFTNSFTLRSLSYELKAVGIFVLSFSVSGIKTYAFCITISTVPDCTVSGISKAGSKTLVALVFHENDQSLI